jgi:FkbM family methyltransferase
MQRQINEPGWRIGAKKLLRVAGRALPLQLQFLIARNRPALTWLIPPGRTMQFDRYLGSCTVQIDTSSKIERQMLSGVYEPHLMRVIDEYIKPEMTVLDIGANVGAVSLALAQRVAPGGAVHAFEPARQLFDRLCRNCDLNPALAPSIHAHNLALGAARGELFWLESSAGPGNGRLIDHEAAGAQRVPVTTLDQWRQSSGMERIDFIKMDVERMELDVVRGGLVTLKRLQPVVLFETLPCGGRSELEHRTRELLELLRECGYDLYNIHRRRRTPIAAGDRPTAHETLALPHGSFHHN